MAAEVAAPQAPSHGLSASQVEACMRANASWPTGDTKKTVWVSEHNALRADMDDLAAAIGALDGQLAAGKALTAWQVRKSGNAGDAMEVECSWSADGGTAIADAVLLRDDAAQHDAAPLPLDVLLMLQPGAAGGPCELTVVLPHAMALRRLLVHSSARTVELFTSASGSAQTAWQYVSSERGAPDGADGFRVEYAAVLLDCVCDAVKLRLLSLRPPGKLALRGVVLDAVPATVAPPAAPLAALMSAMQSGSAAQPGSAAALMGMLGALAGAARPAQPEENVQARRSAAAAPEVAAAAARVHALEVSVGEAGPQAGPQAEPLAALELRIARLEARVERGLADLAARMARVEQGQAAERPP